MMRMISPGGRFYLSTQIGPQRVEFNAHRVFAPETMRSWFDDGWTIERSTVIDDNGWIREGTNAEILTDFHGNLGVGIISAKKT